MARQWKSAVVGVGVVGEWHVRLIPRLPNCSLVAVCDVVPEKAKQALDNDRVVGVPVYSDMREMLRRESSIDVVHICTPSGDHLGPVLAAMEAGKNVICEKPLEIQLDRIDRMIAASKAHGARIAGVFQNRWNDANRVIKQAADEGRFGKLAWAGCFTPWYRPDKYYEEGGWRGTWRLDGGGAVMNQSVHAIDLLQWIAGPVRRVSAYASSRIHPGIEVEDTLSAALEFHCGAFGTVMGTTAMFPGMPARIEVGGENGTAVAENGLKFLRFRDERPNDAQMLEKLRPAAGQGTAGGSSNRDVKLELHLRNVQHVLQCWDEGRDAETSGPEARKAVAIVLAMYESARRGGVAVDVA